MALGRERETRGARGAGIVLVLLSGIVLILLILAMVLLQVTRTWARGADARREAAQARLAAAGGMEYAAGRLARSGYPRFATSASARADDWRCLDRWGMPLSELRNPSFPRGEPWGNSVDLSADQADNDADGVVDEPDEGAPIYSASEPWADRDGDGRFSAWSGRLRGGGDGIGMRFILRAECVDGKIPLNAGDLSAPRHNQAAAGTFHAALEHALNGLGTVVRPLSEAPPLGWVRRLDLPTGDSPNGNPGQPFPMSWLGADLIRSRPLGGYRSLREVEALLASPSLGYRKEDLDRILPFLDLGPYETPAEMEAGMFVPGQPCAFVSLAAAPREVLQAIWTHHVAGVVGFALNLPGLAAGWDRFSTRTGADVSPGATTYPFSQICAMIDRDEAGRLAEAAIARRAAGDYSWNGLYKAIAEQAPEIFERDWQDLDADGNPATASRNQVSWIQVKADLAFTAVAMDPLPVKYGKYRTGQPHFPCATWMHWGIDREGAAGFQGSTGVAMQEISWPCLPIGYPAPPPDPANPWPTLFKGFILYRNPGPDSVPLKLSMAPPSRYAIACLARGGGASAEAAGQLRAAERLDFASQEDFESLGGGSRLARRGVEVANSPIPLLRMDGDSGQPAVTSLPYWNRRSFAPSDYGGFPDYPRIYGALGLSEVEAGLVAGAKVYVPLAEDFDGDKSNFRTQTSGPPYPQTPIPAAGLWWGWGGLVRNPYGYATAVALPQCPGLEGSFALGNTLRELSIEGWLGSGGEITLSSSFSATACRISIRKDRVVQDPDLVLSEYKVYVFWWDPVHGFPFISNASYRIEERDQLKGGDVGRISHGSHVVLAVRRLGSGLPGDTLGTEFRLFVNGRDHPDGTPMSHIHETTQGVPPGTIEGGRLQVTDKETLDFNNGPPVKPGYGVDEVRLYDRALGQGDALDLFRLGRFKRKGTYTSPLYVPEAPARLQLAQWTGIVPAELRSDLADPSSTINPFDVRLQGYEDRLGTVPLGPPVPLGAASGDLKTLEGELDRVRSFRYLVTMDCSTADGVLNETPIFESIWLTLQRQGTAPAWTSWGFR